MKREIEGLFFKLIIVSVDDSDKFEQKEWRTDVLKSLSMTG